MSSIYSGADRKNYFRALLTNTAYYYPCDKSLSEEFKALHKAVSSPYASALDKARFKHAICSICFPQSLEIQYCNLWIFIATIFGAIMP